MFPQITGLMNKGVPVAVILSDEKAEPSPLLYCELIQKARYGESFVIKNQGCKVGAYVLGETEIAPIDYYFNSGRYASKEAARTAIDNLYRNIKYKNSIKIIPLCEERFDVILLFLRPERAMRIVQASSFMTGKPIKIRTGGIASICSDCTAYSLHGNIGISLGCKGGRKHSKYGEDEVIVGIPYHLAKEIEDALGKIPETYD